MHASYGANEASAIPVGNRLEIHLPVPLLRPAQAERIFVPEGMISTSNSFVTLDGGSLVAAFATVPLLPDISSTTERLYRELFEVMGNRHLYRIWNYIPGINSLSGTLETYRHFNFGRWRAFEDTFGLGHEKLMPAASAVGARGDRIAILAIGGSNLPYYLENPDQIPAYQYPDEHGPLAPGFARATVVSPQGSLHGFLSGTASIIGHHSVGSGDLDLQIATTLGHISTMFARIGRIRPDLSAATASFKCYLRHPKDMERAEYLIRRHPIFAEHADILFLEADICRRELDVEIEGIFTYKR